MRQQTTIQAIALGALLGEQALAAIVSNGLWTDNDWYDDSVMIGVANGVPYSNDDDTQRRITAPLSVDGPVDEFYLTLPNVERIKTVFTEQMWNDGFPQANAIYTYDNFLKAAAKFPAFCNESALSDYDDEQTCQRELSAMFAHWGQETGKRDPADGEFWTQALYWVQEIRCNGTNNPTCDYKSTNWSKEAWPPNSGEQYYGRGPCQLSWNYNYGPFSTVYATSTYDAKRMLLDNPDLVHLDGSISMAAGVWFFMTP